VRSDFIREVVPNFDRNATRTLLREIYNDEVDLVVDEKNKVLRVRMHHLATQGHDNALRKLCEALTATETEYPESGLRFMKTVV